MSFNLLDDAIKNNGFALIALIDPDKKNDSKLDNILSKIKKSHFNAIFIGGSKIVDNQFSERVRYIKSKTHLPIILFPGSSNQISEYINTMLYLNLISGRNPKYLIEEQVKGAKKINKLKIETIPTAYILLNGGVSTSVEMVSNTKPLSMLDKENVLSHALAGQFMGNELIYFDCGSGSSNSMKLDLLNYVSSNIKIPIIVGGGIESYSKAVDLSNSGASYIVIGNALENNKYLDK